MAGRVSGIHNTFASLGALALLLILGYIRDATSAYGPGLSLISFPMFLGVISIAMRGGPEDESFNTLDCESVGRSQDLLG